MIIPLPTLFAGGSLLTLLFSGWLRNQAKGDQLQWGLNGVTDCNVRTAPEVGDNCQLSHAAITELRATQVEDYPEKTGHNPYHVNKGLFDYPDSAWVGDVWGNNRYIMSDYGRMNPLPYEAPLPHLNLIAPFSFPGDGGVKTREALFKPTQRGRIVLMETLENANIFQEDYMVGSLNHRTNQTRRALYNVPYPEKTDLRPHAFLLSSTPDV